MAIVLLQRLVPYFEKSTTQLTPDRGRSSQESPGGGFAQWLNCR